MMTSLFLTAPLNVIISSAERPLHHRSAANRKQHSNSHHAPWGIQGSTAEMRRLLKLIHQVTQRLFNFTSVSNRWNWSVFILELTKLTTRGQCSPCFTSVVFITQSSTCRRRRRRGFTCPHLHRVEKEEWRKKSQEENTELENVEFRLIHRPETTWSGLIWSRGSTGLTWKQDPPDTEDFTTFPPSRKWEQEEPTAVMVSQTNSWLWSRSRFWPWCLRYLSRSLVWPGLLVLILVLVLLLFLIFVLVQVQVTGPFSNLVLVFVLVLFLAIFPGCGLLVVI